MADKYEKRERIGEGGFGEVYKAVEKQTGKTWALKRIKQIDQSAIDEVETLQNVKGHANVANIETIFISQRSLWLVTEYCEAGDLNKYFWERRPDVPLKFRLMSQIASGVAFLHSKEITHRDLKPENVMLTMDDRQQPVVKLADFGLAKIHGGAQMSRAYMKTCAGTPFFIAPEVYTTKYNEKADVFSMGLIFRAMVFETSLPCGASGQYLVAFLSSEGFIIPFGEALASNPGLQVRVAEKALPNPSARQLLDAMLQRDPSQRLSAEMVVKQLSSMKPSDFKTSQDRGSKSSATSGGKVETPGHQLMSRLTSTVRAAKPQAKQSQAEAAAALCDAILSQFTKEELTLLQEKIIIHYAMISRNSASEDQQNLEKWMLPVLGGIEKFLRGEKLRGSDAARFAIGWLQFTSMLEKK